MVDRSALLVGSLPYENEAVCMARALDALGEHLYCLADGEVGEKSPRFPQGNRIGWAIYAIERLTEDEETWRVVKQAARAGDGMATNYATIQKLAPRRSPAELPHYVRLGYDRYALESYPIFQRERAARGLARLKFQVGVPTGFAMSSIFANPLDTLRYTYALNHVLAREVNAVVAALGDDMVIQIEVPPEMYLASLLPPFLLKLALLPILDLVAKITPGTQLGMHLCLGDYRNQAMVHPKTLHRLVRFSNELTAAWPDTRPLLYVHYPFCEGVVSPRLEPSYYRPLKDIRLPAGTRFVAGFVHETLSYDDNARVLSAIEAGYGQRVDVATSCGLGRRTPEAASQLLALTRQLLSA